uniref:Uncharacterized protein n=1 Tax=Strombidium rassoulzadegani TaxID=1082188 RepID=A0A7S3CJN7_9SPIT|mmetsp:Transcript_13083/g.22065  ORF Transcript_13083/g.22065 Transcript_13083/m.22065 type:complete len:347 (+) Transcript_13083:1835-2875(+)
MYSNADSQPLFELATLSTHCHPTVRMWAQQLLDHQTIAVEYGGDPLLDFALSNFLDRIAYKEPKSQEKLAKFRNNLNKSVKMSAYEKPVNVYDFKQGERPDVQRVEEEFMYKYLTQHERKQKAAEEAESDDDFEEVLDGKDKMKDDISDAEMEAFAEAEILKEMKRLQSGAGPAVLSDEEDVDVSYSDDQDEASQDENENGQYLDDSEEVGEAGDSEEFFSDQDELEDLGGLSDQKAGGEGEEDDSEDLDLGAVDDYDDEEEEEEEAQKPAKKGQKGKKKAEDDDRGFASYEDFAHLLEEGAEGEIQASKQNKFLKKRSFMSQSRGGAGRSSHSRGGSRGNFKRRK